LVEHLKCAAHKIVKVSLPFRHQTNA
jgi:hypothetical protein